MAVISPVTVPLLVRSTSYSINYVRVQANYSIKNARAGFGMHAKAEQVQKKKVSRIFWATYLRSFFR